VETTVTGPGALTFWWKVSSEPGYDYLSFRSDGLVIDSISGEQTWQQRTNFVPAGSHTFRWRYSKDGSVAAGSDRGWLDGVSFTMSPPTGLTPGSPNPDGSVIVNSNPITLSWNVSGGADRYQLVVYYWDWAVGNWVYDRTVTTTANFMSYSPPMNKTHFAWTVQAGNSSRWSDWANWAFFYGDVPCAFALSASSVTLPASAGGGSVCVSAMPECDWTARVKAHWITLTSAGSGTGNGTVRFDVAANPSKNARTAVVTIGGQTFTVTPTGK